VTVQLTPTAVLTLAGVVVIGFVGFKLYKAGAAVGQAVSDAGAAIYDAAYGAADYTWHQAADRDGAAGVVVSAVGKVVGLPSTAETLDDPAQVRFIIDRSGMWEASKWGTAWAFLQAVSMPAGSGRMPPPGTPAARALGYVDMGTGNGW